MSFFKVYLQMNFAGWNDFRPYLKGLILKTYTYLTHFRNCTWSDLTELKNKMINCNDMVLIHTWLELYIDCLGLDATKTCAWKCIGPRHWCEGMTGWHWTWPYDPNAMDTIMLMVYHDITTNVAIAEVVEMWNRCDCKHQNNKMRSVIMIGSVWRVRDRLYGSLF